MQARRNYLRTLFTTGSSEEVMFFNWQTHPHVPMPLRQLRTSKQPQLRGPASIRVGVGGDGSSIENLNSSIKSTASFGFDANSFALPPPDSAARLSVHLDGIQQSRALASGAAQRRMGPSLRSRTSTPGLAEAAMQSTAGSAAMQGMVAAPKKMNAVSIGGGVVLTASVMGNGKNSFKITTSAGIV